MDRALKLLWLAVGAILLVFLLAGGVMILSEVIGNMGAREEAVRVASDSRPVREEPRAVRYDIPEPIRGTDTRIVMVSAGAGYIPRESVGYASSPRGRAGAAVNVMFVDADGVRLLLDRPAFIRDVSYPFPVTTRTASTPPGVPEPPGQNWISYQIALDDTNGNERLDDRDAMVLYVTDLDGRNLRRVLSPPLRYQSHGALGPSRILVYALEPPKGQQVDEERMPQRAFVYDVPSGRLSPYAAMDSAAARAGQILRR